MKRYAIFIFLLNYVFTWGVACKIVTAFDKRENYFFIENKGQWPEEVLYLAGLNGVNLWITCDGMVFDFYRLENLDKSIEKRPYRFDEDKGLELKGHVVKIKWVNSEPPKSEGIGKLETYYNYFLGSESDKWRSYVGLYKEVIVKGIYTGIDVRYYFDGGMVRFDFKLAAGVDPSLIRWKFEGAEQIEVLDNEMRFKTRFGWVCLKDLRAFQENDELNISFMKSNHDWNFYVERYDKTLATVIDPVVYSTFIGGISTDEAYSMVMDSEGSIYVTGKTLSSSYPVSSGAYDITFNFFYDVFVTKLDSNLNSIIYSTFLGGIADDIAQSIAVDNYNNVYITGWTESENFPITKNSFDTLCNGSADVFVTKLNSNGNILFYSTYLGGYGWDYGYSLVVDEKGCALIAGETISHDFPTTRDVYDITHNGGMGDVFLAKLNTNGDSLIFSTFLGGSGWERCKSIKLDKMKNIYITGFTKSSDYPVTQDGYDLTINGIYDVFVSKLDSSAKRLLYSTFVGGSDVEISNSLVIDDEGSIIIVGRTESVDFPVTKNAYNSRHQGKGDVFVIKLDPKSKEPIFSTFIGGSEWDEGRDIMLDNNGNLFIAGTTDSPDYPPIKEATDETNSVCEKEVFLTVLNKTGSNLLYSFIFGGDKRDEAFSLILDRNDFIILTGYTTSSNYPVSAAAYDISHNGHADVFVLKLKAVQSEK